MCGLTVRDRDTQTEADDPTKQYCCFRRRDTIMALATVQVNDNDRSSVTFLLVWLSFVQTSHSSPWPLSSIVSCLLKERDVLYLYVCTKMDEELRRYPFRHQAVVHMQRHHANALRRTKMFCHQIPTTDSFFRKLTGERTRKRD